jgi:hypothetical protein
VTDGSPAAGGADDAVESPAITAGGAGAEAVVPAPLVPAVTRIVATSAVRLLWRWPGIVVTLAVYAAVALPLYHDSYPNLWGALAAAVAAVAWYGSPMRRLEAHRRLHAGHGH